MTNFFTKMIGGSLLLAASMLLPFSHGYYMPGVQPQTFLPNAEVRFHSKGLCSNTLVKERLSAAEFIEISLTTIHLTLCICHFPFVGDHESEFNDKYSHSIAERLLPSSLLQASGWVSNLRK